MEEKGKLTFSVSVKHMRNEGGEKPSLIFQQCKCALWYSLISQFLDPGTI